MLVVIWLNAARYCVFFDRNETLGVRLFLKLGMGTTVLLNVILLSTYYVSSYRESLHRIDCEADLCTADFALKVQWQSKSSDDSVLTVV